jgi:hypothetical protein
LKKSSVEAKRHCRAKELPHSEREFRTVQTSTKIGLVESGALYWHWMQG